ncbi:MAG: hypothetical protein OEL84_07055 [Nitrosopumilus sp.]|nr:hypothetical protein [Nitrosopumilus sp.]
MVEKKDTKKIAKKTSVKKLKTKTKIKSKKIKDEPLGDGIIIVDDDFEIDQEKVNEERRLYLEEARSQEATD